MFDPAVPLRVTDQPLLGDALLALTPTADRPYVSRLLDRMQQLDIQIEQLSVRVTALEDRTWTARWSRWKEWGSMLLTRLGFGIALSLWAVVASAQTIVSYELRAYNIGATTPLQTFQFLSGNTACNQPASSGGTSNVNPNTAEWDDPAVVGRVCRFVQGSGTLFSVPVGIYEAALVATNDAALTSPESNRAPFRRVDPPAALSGLRLVRP